MKVGEGLKAKQLLHKDYKSRFPAKGGEQKPPSDTVHDRKYALRFLSMSKNVIFNSYMSPLPYSILFHISYLIHI